MAQIVAGNEVAGFGAGEDTRRGADGADATGPDGAGELQAVELGTAFEQADDVAGVEGVAAAGAVDERIGIGAELGREARRRRRSTPCSPRVMTTRRAPSVVKGQGLADRVGLAQDQLGLVGVGNEDVGVGEDDLRAARGSRPARAWRRRAP